jgi:site-specific recombinase XerD
VVLLRATTVVQQGCGYPPTCEGAKKRGVRLGNWLTAEEARRLWQSPDADTLKGKRDRAILAVLLGGGLRRRELADLDFRHLQPSTYFQVLTRRWQ